MRTLQLLLTAVLALAVASACSKSKSSDSDQPSGTGTAGPTKPSDPQAKAKATEIFTTRCVPCHGDHGAGDGPASANLSPKPRAFGDGEWQKSVDDAHIERIIKFGGAAVGKSAAMPSNPDLNDSPEVVSELRVIVRGFAPK